MVMRKIVVMFMSCVVEMQFENIYTQKMRFANKKEKTTSVFY